MGIASAIYKIFFFLQQFEVLFWHLAMFSVCLLTVENVIYLGASRNKVEITSKSVQWTVLLFRRTDIEWSAVPYVCSPLTDKPPG